MLLGRQGSATAFAIESEEAGYKEQLAVIIELKDKVPSELCLVVCLSALISR